MKRITVSLILAATLLAMLLTTDYTCAHRTIYTTPGITVLTGVGQEFSIGLDSNPTTGFSWALAENLDARIVKYVGKEFKHPKEELIGASGKEVWVFKATGKGKTTIKMKYLRSWENKPTEVTYQNFNVVVK